MIIGGIEGEKLVKLKIRNGEIFTYNKEFNNGNYLEFQLNYYSFGLGFDWMLGDSAMYFNLHLLFFRVFIMI